MEAIKVSHFDSLAYALEKAETKLERYRYEVIKFIAWTGIAVIVCIGGMFAKGFHWI